MNTRQDVVGKTTNSKRGLVAGFIVAFASILCATMLSVTAFAGEAGDSVLDSLINQFANSSFANGNNADSYEHESLIISDSSGGEEFNENATLRSVTVHFTNNYVSDAARIELAEPQVLIYEDGQAFNFEVALADDTLGAPRKITLDESLDLSYVIGNDNNHILFTSENGITNNADIDIRYGNEVEAYKILRFYQGSDGDWRDDAITESKTGDIYSTIPTEQEIQDGLTNHPGFVLDTYDNGVVIPGITSMVSIYYARLVNSVVFDDNGGTNGPGAFFERSEVEINKADVKPTRAGYTFAGWFTEPEGGTEVDFNTYTVVPFDKETVYYAHWEMERPNNKYVTVVYWGQKAEVSSSFDTNDYEYISEAYFEKPYNSEFKFTKDSEVHPKTGGIKTTQTEVQYFDADYDGVAERPIADCFTMTIASAKVDTSIKVQDDDYTVYNVYLPRVQYTWDFRSSNKSGSTSYGTITARWGQNISDEYKQICTKAFSKEAGPWVTDWSSGNIANIFTHMNFENKTTSLNNYYYVYSGSTGTIPCYYYIQKVGADDSHSSQQEIDNNYTLYATSYLKQWQDRQGQRWTFSEDEWIKIDGFVAPDTKDKQDTNAKVGDNVTGSSYQFFYKRAESSMSLYMIDTGAATPSPNNVVYITGIDYETTYGDIPVPEGTPGTFVEGMPHTLRYFTPLNPNIDNVDKNYVFGGWALNNNPGSQAIDLDSYVMPQKAAWLYAKWVAPSDINVSFQQVTVPKTETPAGNPIVFENQTYQQKIKTTSQAIPTPTEFENFYFLYWYYYNEGDEHEAANRHYFDPVNMTVPAHDLFLYPEYSSTEPNTEFLVSPVNKPEQFHGSISPDTYFYVKSGEIFTKAGEDALEIMDMDGKTLHSITPTPADGYQFKEWQLTYGGAEDYHKIIAGETAVENVCGVKAVFESTKGPEAAVVTPPIPIPGLQYNGEEQVIATDGVAENGTMQYLVNQSSSEEGTWKDTIDKETEIGTYYVHYYAKGDEGYLDSAHGTIQCKIDKAEYTVYVHGNDVTKQYTGSAIRLSGAECVNFVSEDFPGGIDPEDFTIDENLYVEGTNVGVYETEKELDEYTYVYTGEYADFVNITYEKTQPTVTVLRIVDTPEYTEVAKPTWKQDILYDAKSHDVHDTSFWNGYETDAMTIGGTVAGTSPTTYFAAFTLKDGYKWTDEEADVRIAYVSWKIVATTVPMPTWKQDILYDAQSHNVSDTAYWNNFNTAAMTIGGDVTASASGTYTAIFTLNDGYIWQGGVEPTVRTANVDWAIFIEEVTIPTWKEDLNYTGREYDVSTNPELYWNNFYANAMTFGGTYKATNAGTYTVTFTLKAGYGWADKEETQRTIDVDWTIVSPSVILVDVPTWKADITYDGNEHDVSVNPSTYWNYYSASAMSIGGDVKETEVGTYHATFTLNAGYAWKGDTPSADPVDVEWKIVEPKVKVDNPFVFDPEQPWVLEHDSILVKLNEVGDNPTTINWEIASGDNIEYEATLGKMAVINGLSASETDAVIQVTTSETENYKETTKTCPVKVTAKDEQQVDVDVTEGLYVDEFGMIQVVGIQEKPDMTWEHASGDNAIEFVSVTSTYVVNFKGVAGGTETVKLTLAETEHFAETVIYVDVTILPKVVDELSFSQSSYEVGIGSYIDVSVNGLSAERTNYSWEVVEGDGNIALSYTKNNPVRVNGLAEGTAKIKITAQASIKYTEVSAETTIVVTGKPSQNIQFDKTALTIIKGETGTVTASGLQQKPDVLWTINGDGIAEIDGDADDLTVTVKGLDIGQATLTFVCSETQSYAETEATLAVNVVEGQKVYLANRTGSDSIIKSYSDAVSVKFVSTIPTDYSDSLIVDKDHLGLIKAYKIYDPDNVNYRVEIASNYPMASSATSLAGIFKYFSKLEEVDLSILDVSEATSLQSMFYCCTSIKEIDLSSADQNVFNTSNVTTFLSMFEGCSKVTTIQFGTNVVFGDNINVSKMFRNCTSLTYIVVPVGTDLSGNAGDSSYMFEKCTNLPRFSESAIDKTRAFAGVKSGVTGYFVTSKDIGTSYLANRDTITNTSILADYSDAVSVEFKCQDSTEYSQDYINVDIENKGEIKAYKVPCDGGYKVIVACYQNIASSAKSFEGIFKYFKKLETVDFGGVNMQSAVSLKSMFYCATSLKIISLKSSAGSGFNTSNVNDFSSMFEGCNKVKTINLDKHFVVNNDAKIFQMFRNCNILENIFVTAGTDWSSNTTDSTRMFEGCVMLKNFETSAVDKTRAFVGTKGSTVGYFSLAPDGEISYLKNRTETNIGVLAGLEDATSVTFSGLDDKDYGSDYVNVDIEDVGKIKAYKITEGSTYKVVVASSDNIACSPKSLEGIFKNFKYLTSVNFGNLIVDSATSLKSMFYGALAITNIEFKSTAPSGFNTSNVSNFRSMIEWCPALVSVTFGDGFVVNSASDKGRMFKLCKSLTDINVAAGTDWSGGTGADELMFESTPNLPNFDPQVIDSTRAYVGIKNGVRGYFNNPDTPSTVYLANRSGTTSIIEPYKDAVSVTFSSLDSTVYSSDCINVDINNNGDIKAYKVAEGSGYKVVIASDEYIATSATSFEGIFKNFKKLTTVNFGSVITDDATSLQSMFYCCSALQTIEISSLASTGFNTSGVNNYSSMFESCSALTQIKLGSGFVVSNTAILKQMFLNDTKLSKIIVAPGTDWSGNVGNSSYMFKGDTSLSGYSSTAVDNTRAFVGTKGDVTGYFVTE